MIKTDIKDGWTSGGKRIGHKVYTVKKSENPILFYASVYYLHVLLLTGTSILLIMTYGVINADFDSENAIVDIKQKDTGD